MIEELIRSGRLAVDNEVFTLITANTIRYWLRTTGIATMESQVKLRAVLYTSPHSVRGVRGAVVILHGSGRSGVPGCETAELQFINPNNGRVYASFLNDYECHMHINRTHMTLRGVACLREAVNPREAALWLLGRFGIGMMAHYVYVDFTPARHSDWKYSKHNVVTVFPEDFPHSEPLIINRGFLEGRGISPYDPEFTIPAGISPEVVQWIGSLRASSVHVHFPHTWGVRR